MRRAVVGWLFIVFGAATITCAVAGCVWVYLNVSAEQFDLRPVWLVGGLVVASGGTLLGAGLHALARKS